VNLPGQTEETIVALSTPPGRSAIGVIRLSGPTAHDLLSRFFQPRAPNTSRLARYGRFLDGPDTIDDVVTTTYTAPHSYTGEDMVEISAHGNPLVLGRIITALIAGGARRAEPGEFTLRAVGNGRMDLGQAEAIRDFIAAQTDRQARTARLQMEGGLSRRIGPSREQLLGIVAELEAAIDFAEDDVPLPSGLDLAARVRPIAEVMARLAGSYEFGRVLSVGALLAVAGKPNVGKSSIFNRLVDSDRAIVTEVAGTTRDVLTETITVAGIPVRFADTAGLRVTADRVEALGVDRTLETMAEADLTLVVLDSARPLDAEDDAVLARARKGPHVLAANKSDLPPAWDLARFPDAVRLSAVTGEGVAGLRQRIEDHLVDGRPEGADDLVITSLRQRDALDAATAKLRASATALEAGTPHEMVLVDLYAAISSIGELTGDVTTDDILDRVFSTFCIGK
jgi:tRNA modification GTPase